MPSLNKTHSSHKTTHPGATFKGSSSERQYPALNGDSVRRMELRRHLKYARNVAQPTQIGCPEGGLPIRHCASDSATAALTRAFPPPHTGVWGGVAMANDQPRRWERQVREAALRVEEDLRRVVAYINDQVVPERPARRVPGAARRRRAVAEAGPAHGRSPRRGTRRGPRLLLNPLRQRRTSRSLEPHRSPPPPQCHRAWPGAGQDSELGAASRACAWTCGLPPQEQDGPLSTAAATALNRSQCDRRASSPSERSRPSHAQRLRTGRQPPLRSRPCRTASRSPARLAWQAGTALPTPTARRPTAAYTTRTP